MSNEVNTKTITILIAGAVFIAGLIMGFGSYVFAGDPAKGLDITIGSGDRVSDIIYDSSFSKTKSIGLVRKEVGDVLLRYGVGGADINKVTDALEGGGVYEAELKRFLLAIGMNEQDTQNILLEFDKIGISLDGDPLKEGAQGVSTPVSGDTPQPAIVNHQELHRPPTSATTPATGEPTPATGPFIKIQGIPGISTPITGDVIPQGSSDPLKGLNVCKSFPKGKCPGIIKLFHNDTIKSIQDLKVAESKEQREKIIQELSYHRVLLQQGVQALRQDLRENAKDLRDNFQENVKTTIGHVDHGKTARIAVAHGKGLRMINRYRSAIARFDHILGRMESRIEKLEARRIEVEAQARAKGKVISTNPPKSLAILIEEAKNMQVENEAKLAELEAKYESLLTGQNPQGVAGEAREIAKELKSEIEKLHGLLDDIRQATGTINTTKSNTF